MVGTKAEPRRRLQIVSFFFNGPLLWARTPAKNVALYKVISMSWPLGTQPSDLQEPNVCFHLRRSYTGNLCCHSKHQELPWVGLANTQYNIASYRDTTTSKPAAPFSPASHHSMRLSCSQLSVATGSHHTEHDNCSTRSLKLFQHRYHSSYSYREHSPQGQPHSTKAHTKGHIEEGLQRWTLQLGCPWVRHTVAL